MWDVVTHGADLETRLLASIFGTLLSSQGSDAHRSCAALAAWLWGNPSILSASILGVKSVPRRPVGHVATGVSALGSLRGSPLYQSFSERLPAVLAVQTAPADRCKGWESVLGTGHLALPRVSVPPCRADG